MVSTSSPAGEAAPRVGGQELLETFLGLVPDAAVVVDRDGVIISTNAQATKLFGYPEEALVGQRIEVLVPERFRHRHREHRSGYADHPRARTMGAGQDLTGRRADGSEFAIDISLAPLGLMDRPLVVAAVRDATERRAATAAQAQLAAIVESSLDGIVAMGTTGVVMSWNSGAQRLLGYAADEIVGSHISRLIPPEQAEAFEMLLSATLEGTPVAPRDTEWQTVDGRRLPIALTMSPLLGPGAERVGFSVSIRDITERKQAEQETARLLAEVRKQERWQAATADIRLGVLSGESLPATLARVCDCACDLTESDTAIILLSAEGSRVAAASGRVVALVGTPVDQLSSVLTDAIERRASHIALQPLGLPPILEEAIGPGPLVSVIVAAGKAEGVLIISAPGDPRSAPSPMDMADSLATQAALAIELDRARRDSERLLLAEDRDRIARDLHDVVIQRLFASGMSLQGALSLVGDERAATRISTVVDNLDTTISEIRTAIFALGQVRGDGRVRADVVALTQRTADQLGFKPSVHFDGAIDTMIPLETAAHVLAVLTEALSNVVRHAQASSLEVVLSVGDEVVLVVVDDGIGLGTPQRRSGLANMQRRAEGLGGSMAIDSEPGAGTRLVWRVPLAR